MPALRSPQDLLALELKEIHSAEKQLGRILPRLGKKTTSDRLREMLDQRREQGATLIEQIDEALSEMQVSKGRAKNVAAEGLIEDMNHHLEDINDERFYDPVLLASVQKVEHYCIAAWGTVAALGRMLEQQKVVDAMEQALEDGKRLDQELTDLAEQEVNPRLLEMNEQGGEEKDEGEEEEEGETAGAEGGRSSRGRSSSRRK